MKTKTKTKGQAGEASANGNGHANGFDVAKILQQPRGKLPEGRIEWSQIVRLPVESLERHPANRIPLEADVAGVAQSMAGGGQGEPVKVRQLAGERYQIISGETRVLAARRLSWKILDCRVAELTDAQALEQLAEGNAHRKDLSPIDRGRLVEQLCRPVDAGGAGLSREEAAKRIGLESASAASNLVRLLELPDKVLERVAAGEIAESKARLLLPYNFSPAFVAELAKETDWDGTREYLEGDVWREALHQSRPIDDKKGTTWDDKRRISVPAVAFKPTAEQLEQLQVVEIERPKSVGGYYGESNKERRAINVKLWDKLQKQGIEAWIEQGGNKQKGKAAAKGKPDKPAKPVKLTPAQERKVAAERADKLDKRIHEWRIDWLREIVGREYQSAPLADGRAIKLALYVLNSQPHWESRAYLAAAGRKIGLDVPKNQYGGPGAWEVLATATAEQCQELLVTLAGLFMDPPDERRDPLPRLELLPEVVEQQAVAFGVDLAEQWKLLQTRPGLRDRFKAFLELHSREQLAELATEWKVPPAAFPKKSDLVDHLFGFTESPVKPLPKCLAPIESTKPRKKRRKSA
jgi:ParB/RepB/Spo0J family partition protein